MDQHQPLLWHQLTNGTHPEMIGKILPTPLYLSLNAPDEATYLWVCNPARSFWEEIQESLEIPGRSRTRTTVRIALIKGLNMLNPEGYARLLQISKPDYIEVKAYMRVGFSRKRLGRDVMLHYDEVFRFASKIGDEIGYQIADDASISRVVLLSRDWSGEGIGRRTR